MKTLYTPIDIDLLKNGAYYWCASFQGGPKPSIVQAWIAPWNDKLWVISAGNEHTDVYVSQDPAKCDGSHMKLLGPIDVPEEL